MNRLNIKYYIVSSSYFVGEVMYIEGRYITIVLYPDKYYDLGLSTPLYITSDECGIIAISVSNVTRAKYGKEFALVRRNVEEDISRLYPDLKSHYNYIIKAYNLYNVSKDGVIHRKRGCNPTPHDPVYLLDKEDVKKLFFNSSFNNHLLWILARENPDPMLFREILYNIKEISNDYDKSKLLKEMLSSLYSAGYKELSIFIRDFKEVFIDEE